MPFDDEAFLRRYPYLFHITARSNLGSIRESRVLLSAFSLANQNGSAATSIKRRITPHPLDRKGQAIWLQTQRKLSRGHIELDPDFTFEGLVQLLNSKVFFWPGMNAEEPIGYGIRYRKSNDWPGDSMTIRVPLRYLITSAEFSRCNSGSPRTNNGIKAKRGPKTFLPAPQFVGSLSDVVVFDGRVALPESVEFYDVNRNCWKSLFDRLTP